ncbi:hypothetical protein PS002_23660, partial [Shigella sonnei]|nr:hypothetical protein [Shigella sonnei]
AINQSIAKRDVDGRYLYHAHIVSDKDNAHRHLFLQLIKVLQKEMSMGVIFLQLIKVLQKEMSMGVIFITPIS